MRDGVYFSRPTVAIGLGIWDEMASGLKEEWEGAFAEIEGHLAAAPWGQGTEGASFLLALLRGGGPQQMIRTGRENLKRTEAISPTMRETISRSVATDEAEAARIRQLLEG
jgi:hypothetical protein